MTLIIYANFIPFIGLLFMLAITLNNPLFSKRQIRLFIIAITVNLVMLAIISADYLLADAGIKYEYAWAWRRITSFLNFAAAPLVPLLLLKIFDKTLNKSRYYIPIIINALLCFASMFFRIIFFITTENKYSRGPLFFLPFIISVFYILLMMTKPASTHSNSKRAERIFLLGVIALIGLCMYFEIAEGYRFLSWDGAALAFILYCLLLTLHCFIVDPLTNAYNRLMYSRALAGFGRGCEYVIAMLDINDFKTVNDKYGHEAGDEHLIKFAETVMANLPKGAVLYRIGGDEFAALYKKGDAVLMDTALEAAREQLSVKGIYFALGIAQHHPGEDMDDAIKRADERMYLDKTKTKNRDDEEQSKV